MSSGNLVSVLPSDCYQLANHRVRQRMVDGAWAVEGAHGVLHGLLGIGVVLTYIPAQRHKLRMVVIKNSNLDVALKSKAKEQRSKHEQLLIFCFYVMLK